jgi:hypothetical protein
MQRSSCQIPQLRQFARILRSELIRALNNYGYQESSSIQQGRDGTPVLQETWQYFSHTANGITVNPLASDTVYRNTDGTGAETTSFSYTFFAGTVGMESMTTTLPVISAVQNGSGVAQQTESVFNTFGEDVWDKDEDGFISYTAYDLGTWAPIETIQDVNTADASEFSNLPAGWETPTGGGLNLITTYEVDPLGRDIEITSPGGNVTYTVYNDAAHEVRVYQGWDAATGTPTGPTQVYIDDIADGYTETLTMSAAPLSAAL